MVRELHLAYLSQFDDAGWLRVVDRIQQSIHPVDRAATSIWFHLFPLALQRAMLRPDAATLARRMTLAGHWQLAEQPHTSHHFLYAHRYWAEARQAVLDYVDAAQPPASLDLAAQVHAIATQAALRARVRADVLLGIAAVALRTLAQVGPDVFGSALPVSPPASSRDGGPDAVLAARRAGRGWLADWLGRSPRLRVVFDEQRADGWFPIVHSQHVATAAALDVRPHRERDARCSEGPIPVHCRSCSCGTCWVGVLAGADALSPMEPAERAKLVECGVVVEGSHPVMRLACMAQAYDRVAIVVPPWNGLVGRVLRSAA